MSALIWPDWIAPNVIEWWLETQSRSGGQTILGNEKIVASPSARWRCTMNFRIWGTQADPSRLLFWRALMGRLYGRSGSFLIGPFDKVTPARLAGASTSTPLTPFSDTAHFADTSLFSQAASLGAVAAAAARGARALTVTYSGLGTPQAGQYFGLGGSAIYLADSCLPVAAQTYALTFSPGLRADAALGDDVDFERPRATMRLMADDGGRAKLGIGNWADTTLDLVEVF